ncbi:MAG TPA: hypothetical protein VIN08_03945 [Ohtaekwangia sp.]|uniref:hypothetical protein n=1 Tax=Ohtaekwangia sp. TaxID=2066019 RepID=UPI002F927454
MIRNRILLKSIAVFLILETVFNTVAPTISWALTSGPMAPELTSFAPIDSSQMVNKLTGDLDYQMPLLEVSSPEGSYPLNLSYKSGVKLNQESSFCGLGWSINVGSINRIVNGFADDYNGASYSVRDQWEGGNAYSEGAGLDLGSFGLWFEGNWSTHSPNKEIDFNVKAFGVGFDSKTQGISFSMSYDSDNDEGYSIIGIASKMNMSYDYGGGLATAESSAMQAFNNNNNRVQSKVVTSKNYLVYKYEKRRYWIDETDDSKLYGPLQGQYLPATISDDIAFDRFVSGEFVSNPTFESNPLVIRENNEFLAGPSFPSFDIYSVTAQGIGGNMQPVILDNATTFDRKKLNLNYRGLIFDIGYDKPTRSRHRPQFRFKNDFSNSYKASNVTDFALTNTGASIDLQSKYLGYDQNIVDPSGFNSSFLELAGSSKIRYFENQEILNGTAKNQGFVKYVRDRTSTSFASYDKSYTIANQVGGFSVTSPEGITYHYGLPVYTYENGQKFQKFDEAGKLSSRVVKSEQPYAYTWLLTSITGADFVDKNDNGVADEGDWGYWMNFVYGKSGTYKYRLPAEDNSYIVSSDGSKSFSYGKRENYYLDAIYSRTQTCFFVKDIRVDTKGVLDPEAGGFGITTTTVSAPSLKVNEIILMDNKNFISSGNTILDQVNIISNKYATDEIYGDCSIFNTDIITKADADLFFPGVNDYILRKIVFDYDYSLCPGTTNSFDIDYNSMTKSDVLQGKLTLKRVNFLGKQGTSLLPAYNFDYEGDRVFVGGDILNSTGKNISIRISNINLLAKGDIIQFTANGGQHYGLVTDMIVESNTASVKLLYGPDLPEGYHQNSISVNTTNNPPYSNDLYDWWGYYKPDYFKDPTTVSENDLYRMTNELSSKSVDSWSLRSITTSLGEVLSFDYSSKDYDDVGVGSKVILNVSNKTGAFFDNDLTKEYKLQEHDNYHNGGHIKYLNLYVVEHDLLNAVKDQIPVGSFIDILSYTEQISSTGGQLNTVTIGQGTFTVPLKGQVKIESIGSDYIKISDPNHVLLDYQDGNGQAKYHRHFLSFLILPDTKAYGDGIKVNSITLETNTGVSKESTYTFNQGITVSEPSKYSSLCTDKYAYTWDMMADDYDIAMYEREFQRLFSPLRNVSGEIPGPSVVYGLCTVNNYVGEVKLDRYTSYKFKTFDPTLIQGSETDEEYYYSSIKVTGGSHESRTLRIKDFTSQIGNILSIKTYDSKSNQLLNQVNYDYISDYDQYHNQGILDQVFNEHRIIHPHSDGVDIHLGTVSIISSYPSVLESITSYDAKHLITNKTIQTGFDFFSGAPIATQAQDVHGNEYVTEKIPAYSKYPNMGLALNGGKNMLIQEAASYTYKVDPSQNNKKLGLVSASVQTWSDKLPTLQQGKLASEASAQNGIWRKAASFNFIGSDNVALSIDGLYPAQSVTNFTAWNKDDAVPDGWQKTAGITLYDVNSHALEATDVNGNYAATRMTFDQSRVTATAANANYNEFAYSNAEDQSSNNALGSEVYQNGNPNTNIAHTGSSSLTASANTRGFTYTMVAPKQRTYRVSVWSSQPVAAVKYKFDSNAEAVAPVKNKGKAGNWYLLEADIAVNTTTVSKFEMWCEAGVNATNFDDFRVRPVDAAMTSYVYNQWGELSHILDNNNLYTEYRYDAMGRLTSTYKESFKSTYGNQGIVKTGDVEYNYGSNNPYTLTISTSSTGTRGYIYPSGNVSVQQGKDLRFEMRDKCSYNTLGAVWIDGKKIDVDKSSVTLADGTLVSIQSSGKVITFTNVQTAHTIRAEFAANSVKGVVVCNGYTDGNGNTCYDGGYKYVYYDLCGNQGSWMNATRAADVPADLQSLIPTSNCCQYNDGTISGCSCRPGGN